MKTLVEPFGITYDRFRLTNVFKKLVARHDIRDVVEVPASGEKAMPSIYSLALAVHGCRITLVNPVSSCLYPWDELGFSDRIKIIEAEDPGRIDLPDESFDLAWNFVTLSKEPFFERVLSEMKRLSRNLVITVHYSGLGLGYPWHRLLHLLSGYPWTHGDTRFNFPRKVKDLYRKTGLSIEKTFPLDSPPWPDPPGFRDIILHRKGIDSRKGDPGEDVTWRAPYVEYLKKGDFPSWMKLLNFMEELPIPSFLKYPFSHLFLVIGKKQLTFSSRDASRRGTSQAS